MTTRSESRPLECPRGSSLMNKGVHEYLRPSSVKQTTPKTKWNGSRSCGQQLVSAPWGVELHPLLRATSGDHERNEAKVVRVVKVTSHGGVTPISGKRTGKAQHTGRFRPKVPLAKRVRGCEGGCPGHGEETCDPLEAASAPSPPSMVFHRKARGPPAGADLQPRIADCRASSDEGSPEPGLGHHP